MGTAVVFKPTAIQRKALTLLKSSAKHILLFGGSRSGKTTVLVMAIIYRALRFSGSRHLICRYRAKDARSSVLRETLFPWLDNTVGKSGYTYLAHESMITLFNGSEIWIGSLGDREQADKILGHEYNTIYFNEISQLSYAAVTTAYSRLAMRITGCRNLFYYDCNPGSPLHWAYKVFVLKRTFLTGEPLEKAELYASMMLNPEDNKDNLPEDYIADILDVLPDPNNKYNDRPWLDNEYALNKYIVSQNGNGVCTAYLYCYHTDTESYATPILYSNVNEKPYMRKSQNEKNVDISVWPPSRPIGWRSNTFELNGSISAGDYIWFGVHSSYFTTRFDYGGVCYKGWFDWDLYEDYEGEPAPYIHIGQWDSYCTIKWSWYFNYVESKSQNFVRTLTQGVTLTDSQKLQMDYKRTATQNVLANMDIHFLKITCRIKKETVQANVTDILRLCGFFLRRLNDKVEVESEVKHGWTLRIIVSDTVHAVGSVFRGLLLTVRIVTGVFVRDYILGRFLKAQSELEIKSCVQRELVLESKIK